MGLKEYQDKIKAFVRLFHNSENANHRDLEKLESQKCLDLITLSLINCEIDYLEKELISTSKKIAELKAKIDKYKSDSRLIEMSLNRNGFDIDDWYVEYEGW